MRFAWGIIFLIHLFKLQAQTTIPTSYFRSPIDSAISLAGNFGELRPNHFHAGLDIKTNNKEGVPVKAVADGYVSRIKIATNGYGKCLYITHPNGYVSVYAHLKKMNGAIADYLKAEQYKIQSFELDIYPEKNLLIVKKGDVVALSGNTGGSSGPHLHFELREEKSEAAVNPQLFGIMVKDTKAPELQSFTVSPLDSLSLVNGTGKTWQKTITPKNKFVTSDTIRAYGNIGISVECFDTETNSTNKNGVYKIELLVNQKMVYRYRVGIISFEESRYINCHSNFAEQINNSKWMHRCYLLPNNKLNVYDSLVNRGVLTIEKGQTYNLTILLSDFSGNVSKRQLVIVGSDQKSYSKILVSGAKRNYYSTFRCTQPNEFKTNDIVVLLPENTLYEDLRFEYYSRIDSSNNYYTPVHQVFSEAVPAHIPYSLSIKTTGLTDQQKQKACIVSLNSYLGKRYEGGTFKNDWITTQTKIFGKFTVGTDTIAPVIRPINIKNGKSMKAVGAIRVHITDNFTGIKSYVGKIDDQWILMEYDYKSHMLVYEFDEAIKPGIHLFSLVVTDHLSNEATYRAKFSR